ncbi:gas vesicle protein K [Streptomyces sp. P9-2]|uniref:gas vesicle protein K n=1 Tax=Streptomyces sp. P9-2 TaxID=3423201 RepID=UPI003F742413
MTDEPRPRAPEAAPDPVTVTDADLCEGRSPLDPEASFDARPEPADRPAEPRPKPRRRLDLEPDTVERDLVKLVLTVVELLRQLMERQAVRRFDEGDLTEEQEERVGLTLMLLEDRMAELRNRYGLRPEDLNLDLGPLGPLLPRD